MQVSGVAPCSTGELKVLPSSNPLDEKVSMRHSGDFAAKPDDYEFEWRYAPPQDGVTPPIYTYAMTQVAASNWQFVQNPAGALPTSAEYSAAPAAGPLPFSLAIRTDAARAITRHGRVARRANNVDRHSRHRCGWNTYHHIQLCSRHRWNRHSNGVVRHRWH